MSPRRDAVQPKKTPRKSLPDELARDAVAHEKAARPATDSLLM
jgi:hypothetical protein